MQDKLGIILIALIMLLFLFGTGSLLLDSLFNKSVDIKSQQLQDHHKSYGTYTVKFSSYDDDDMSII